jgi:hypothetical protein
MRPAEKLFYLQVSMSKLSICFKGKGNSQLLRCLRSVFDGVVGVSMKGGFHLVSLALSAGLWSSIFGIFMLIMFRCLNILESYLGAL